MTQKTLSYINELIAIDKLYDNEEDKNYYLFHKYANIASKIDKDDLEQFLSSVLLTFEDRKYSVFRDYILFIDGKTDYPMENIRSKTVMDSRLNIIDFYQNYDENLLTYLKGCLFIENCLNHLLIKKKENTEITFFNKINKVYSLGLITDKIKKLLLSIKNIRNSIAHDLFYQLDYNEIFDMVVDSSNAGVIYSDDCIWKNRKFAFEFYGISGLLNELFPNLFSMIVDDNCNLFSNDEYCNLLL